MIKEDILKVKTCELKVNIYCQGCVKKLEKILHKIGGVYQTTIDAHQGKVTITGVMEPEAVIKKLKKSGKLAHLWDLDTEPTSEVEKLQLSGEGNSQPQDGASSSGGGGAKDSEMPFPVSTGLTKEDADADDSDSNEDIEDDNLENLMRTKPVAVLPVIGGDEKNGAASGSKNGGGESEIPVMLEAEDTNNGGERDSSTKQNQSSGGSHVVVNSAVSRQLPGLVKSKDGGAGGPPTGVSAPTLLPQPAGAMMRPPTPNELMASRAGFPGMGGSPMVGVPMRRPGTGGNGMQPGGFGGAMYGMPAGGMPGGAGYYPGGAGGGGGFPSTGPGMMMQAAAGGNLMAAPPHQHMMQPPAMMMNGHGPHGHHGHGGHGYPPMGYGNGFGHPPTMQYPPLIYYPTMLQPQPHPHDNIFSDENPHSCSLM